jgi:hypothetical protein
VLHNIKMNNHSKLFSQAADDLSSTEEFTPPPRRSVVDLTSLLTPIKLVKLSDDEMEDEEEEEQKKRNTPAKKKRRVTEALWQMGVRQRKIHRDNATLAPVLFLSIREKTQNPSFP